MILESQTVIIKWTSKNKRIYENLGYVFTKLLNPLEIDVKHLHKGSHQQVKYRCDNCGKEDYRQYRKLIVQDIHYCKKCSKIRREETCLKRYGVKNTFQSEEKKEKIKQTLLNKYGVDNPLKNEDIKNKVKETCLKKYNVENVFQAEEIKDKIKKTCKSKYGYEHSSQNSIIKGRRKQTCLNLYGTEHALQNEKIKNKMQQTCKERYGNDNIMRTNIGKQHYKESLIKKYGENFYRDNVHKVLHSLYDDKTKCFCSKGQKQICEWTNGILNHIVGKYHLDIALNNNIYIEYDGTGHWFPITLNKISKNQFKRKELIRNKSMEKLGWKLIRIINKTKTTLDKEEFLKLYNFCYNFLINTKYKWIKIYYDKKVIISNIFIKSFEEVLNEYK